MGRFPAPVGLRLMKKNDVVLIAVIVILAFAAFVGVSLYSASASGEGEAVVYLDGEEQGRYPLDQDCSIEIPSGDGKYNRLEIKDGQAAMAEATCPDKVCVKHRPVKKQGESLVCLPNKVVVEIENGGEPEVDGAAR